MSSYFLLELDTTSPVITIKSPHRTIPDNVIEVIITSDSKLSVYQDIYIIDSEGKRNDVIFYKVDDYTFIGYVNFRVYPIGMAYINVTLADEVLNLSNQIVQPILIGYLSEKDNYDAYASYTINKTDVSFDENMISLSKQEGQSNAYSIKQSVNTQVLESEVKVGVSGIGTSWRYN